MRVDFDQLLAEAAERNRLAATGWGFDDYLAWVGADDALSGSWSDDDYLVWSGAPAPASDAPVAATAPVLPLHVPNERIEDLDDPESRGDVAA